MRRDQKTILNHYIDIYYVELTAVFNCESKRFSMCIMQSQFKGLALNSCVAQRKPLMSKVNQTKKTLNMLGSIGWGSICLVSPDLSPHRVMGALG